MDETAEVDLSQYEPVEGTPSTILGEYESFLLYGPGGTGKTFTAATAPEPQWWFTPGGTQEVKTIFSKKFIEKHGRKEFFVTSVLEDREKGQVVDNPPGYDRCCHAVDAFLEWNDRKGMGIKTIIVDNATRLEEYMMNKAIFAEFMLASNQDKTVLRAERDFGIRKPHDSTYGGAQSFMDRWVNWLKERPFHLVFVAHDYEVTQPIYEGARERRLVSVRPLFVGVQRTSIPNKFDNVWFHQVSGGGRSRTWGVQSERDEIHLARTRVGGIIDSTYERDPDLTEIIGQFKAHAVSLEEE